MPGYDRAFCKCGLNGAKRYSGISVARMKLQTGTKPERWPDRCESDPQVQSTQGGRYEGPGGIM